MPECKNTSLYYPWGGHGNGRFSLKSVLEAHKGNIQYFVGFKRKTQTATTPCQNCDHTYSSRKTRIYKKRPDQEDDLRPHLRPHLGSQTLHWPYREVWSQICYHSVLYNNRTCNRFATTPPHEHPGRPECDIKGVPHPRLDDSESEARCVNPVAEGLAKNIEIPIFRYPVLGTETDP